RAMTRAIPRALRIVPGDGARHVRADRRSRDRRAASIAIQRDLLSIARHDAAGAARHFARGTSLRAREPIANHVVRIIFVLADVVPRGAAENFFPSRIEELAPRILAPDHAIGGHHSGERAERQPVAGESGAGELPLGGLADVRQTVRRFDYLPRPAMRDVDAT